MNKLNRMLELAGVELNERQAPPQKGGKEPEDKQPLKVEVKKIGTDQPKKEKKLHRNMAETMIGDLLAQKYIKSLEKGHEKVISLAAHILTISDSEIKTLLSKFKVSEKDVKQIIDWANKTK